MTASIAFNPMKTTNAAGSFNTQSQGLIQGTAWDAPDARFQLSQGWVGDAETIPMWGGIGISEIIPGASGGPQEELGSKLIRATSVTAPTLGQQPGGPLTGFTVFDQAHGMITNPQNPVPLAGSYQSISYYRLGSRARIAVKMDPALVDLQGYLITSLVSWDYGGQQLGPYVAAYPANVFTAQSWSAGVVTATTTSAHNVVPGDDIVVSGSIPTGYNGNFVAITGTTGSTLKYALATNPGAETTLGQLNAGGGALSCKILRVEVGNSMTVDYDGTFATWDRSGSAAIILL